MKITDRKSICSLLKMVEDSMSRKIKSSTDFLILYDAISSRSRETISVSTLKRLWGYDKCYHHPYYSTLSILSRFVGFKDWDDFVSNKYCKSPTSFAYTASALFSKDLEAGDQIRITWKPNRFCELLYVGNNRYEVQAAKNSKLRIGDRFSSHHFSEGVPLFLDDFIRNNREPITFVVGYDGGLSTIKIIKRKKK